MTLKPVPYRRTQEEDILEELRSLGNREISLGEVLSAIKAQDMRPMKTLNRMLKWNRIKFVGQHKGDQRYRV